ncbi:unnamed protein product [Soboliphyme baturini]|uniref:Synaptobrevin homolog YKT6 n=1 Tax=Soboliphyme baturini TaxID=241478 RepID=A0A183IAG0_9BILA|nr:unnamed protein product [Soboliphyme baturini]
MKIFGIVIYYKDAAEVRVLKNAFELQSFGFFQRASVRDFIVFTGKLIIERSGVPARCSVKEQEYMCHVYIRSDRLSALVVADSEYPNRVAHNMMTKLLDDFGAKVPNTTWTTGTDSSINYPDIDLFLNRYQNPRECDAMTKVQEELDETKVILHNTIQAVLERGEKLDDLVERSEGLTMQSKLFYKQARRMNKCCTWI